MSLEAPASPAATVPGAVPRGRPSIPAVIWLTLVWILMCGDPT